MSTSKIGTEVLEIIVGNKGDILRIVFSQRYSNLEISVDGLIQNIGAPRVDAGGVADVICVFVIHHLLSVLVCQRLTSKPAVTQRSDSETYLHSIVALVEPAVGEVELEHLRLIDESVLVHVVGDDVARDVAQDDSAPFVAHL